MMKRSIKRCASMLVAALVLSLALVSGIVPGAQSGAHAASVRAAGGVWTPLGGWLGNYFNGTTGTYVYCVDLWADDLASGGEGLLIDALDGAVGAALGGTRAISGAELQMMNYAVSVHGQTSDDITAAAVSAFVWNLTSTTHHGSGEHYISGPHADAVLQKYLEISADTAANYAAGAGGSGTLTVKRDPMNHYSGSIEIAGLHPAHSLGSVTLSNAVFADTGSPTRNGLNNNTSLQIIAVPPIGESSYAVSAEGAFSAEIEPRYDANVQLHQDTGQRSVGPGTSSRVTNYTLRGADPDARSTLFQPVIGTRVQSKFVQLDESFIDVLSFSTRADSGGLHHPWYRDRAGNYLPVTARGTLYGPFDEQPALSDAVPLSAPVTADNIMVTTSLERGPTGDYLAASDVVASEAGFYTWVWRILADDQPAETRAHLPAGYRFEDSFGQVAETSITPTTLAISTKLTEHQVDIGGSVADEVTVAASTGTWLRLGGEYVPAKLIGTAYFSETEPVVSEEPPADVEVIGELSLVTEGPGAVLSESITMPMRPGYVTFQWCLHEADQPVELRGLIRQSCDHYGQPAETVQVLAPTAEPTPEPPTLAVTGDSPSNGAPLAPAFAVAALALGLIVIASGLMLSGAHRRRA